MTTPTHRHDTFHRGHVPEEQLGNGPPGAGYALVGSGLGHADWAPMAGTVNFIIGGGGGAITTGVKGDLELGFAGYVTAARLFADQTGSIVVDLWKDTYANFPPTVADTITASAKPTLSSAVKAQDTTLTGWTTRFMAGDILRVNVDSASTVTRVTLSLTIMRSPGANAEAGAAAGTGAAANAKASVKAKSSAAATGTGSAFDATVTVS